VVGVGAFLALALLGLPQMLPGYAHLLLLLAWAAAIGAAIVLGRRRFRAPGPGAALRRLERDSRLEHRPFETLADRPADGGEAAGTLLWRLHLERQRRRIAELRLAPPRPDLPARDPRAVRLLVVLALVAGFVVAGPRSGSLILASLTPQFGNAASMNPLEAWIKPPAYTGLAPILLKAGDTASIAVPTGSTLEAHVTGGSRTPRLALGDIKQEFKSLGGSYTLSYPLTAPGTLAIRRGWSTISEWPITIIPDNKPVVAFAADPTRTQSGALKIDYRATDDYGVAAVELRIRQAPDIRAPIPAEPIAAALASGRTEKELKGDSFQDLTAHPWAGTKVLAKLVATDVAGQTGESAEIAFTLPERNFNSPVARAIVAARKNVIFGDQPKSQIALRLMMLLQHPEQFHEDLSVFMALDVAANELRQRPSEGHDRLVTIEDLLWNAALKIEDGDRPEAEKELRAAEKALENALKDPNTPASEIARLTQNLKDAMNRDIDAIAENMRKAEQNGEQSQPPDPNAQVFDRSDLNSQIDKMNQMAESGSRDAAQDMLDYIKNLLENMRAGQEPGKANQDGQKAMDKLKDLAKKQRDLENGDSQNSAQDQEALRQSLGKAAQDIGDSMGDIPSSMSKADKAMRNAEHALRRGAKGGAASDQEQAAGELDEAAKSISEQMSQMSAGMRKGEGKSEGQDPLGRNRFDKGTKVKVPTDREITHSLEILDELRRRAGDRDRPRMELDYLRRLLQQY
jgi:uncharacterized protein (TIGR02302 family)